MAEEKPKDSSGSSSDPLVEIVSLFLIFFVLISFLNSVVDSFRLNSLFSKGLKGFSKNELILQNTRPLNSALNKVNLNVLVSAKDAVVYGDDLVTRVSKQKFSSVGRVIKGPVSFLGSSFVFVDFKEGDDGFVKESDLSFKEKEVGIISKIIIYFYKILDIFWYILLFVCIIFIFVIVYLKMKTDKIVENVREKLFPSVIEEKAVKNQNPKWQRVVTHSESSNPSDWRLAVIEADILLSELLNTMNLVGDSIGDKLKSVEKSDFVTLDLAWEAHKVRNRIAHDGADFVLTQREAKRVIELYQKVFEEFSFV